MRFKFPVGIFLIFNFLRHLGAQQQYILVPVVQNSGQVQWPQQYLQAINSPQYIVGYQNLFSNLNLFANRRPLIPFVPNPEPEIEWEDFFGEAEFSSGQHDEGSFDTEYIPNTKICGNCYCGARYRRRIVGGSVANVYEFPFLTVLEYQGEYYCGGSLINNRYVLTAAHCLDGFSARSITVRFLEHDRFKRNDTSDFARTIERVIMHRQYNPGNFDRDIGLLRLKEPIDLGKEQILRPICLPNEAYDYSGEIGVAAGWGATSENGPSSSVVRKVSLPIMTTRFCRSKTRYGASLTDNMMCAGFLSGVKDACQGDSGGPLMVTQNKRVRLAGITSWGNGCARPNNPGVFTRVQRFLKWIVDNTKDACYCS